MKTAFNPQVPFDSLPDLPPTTDLNSPELLKATIEARSILGELKGALRSLDNPALLLNTIILRESQVSSEIENIVTTQDDLFRAYSHANSNNLASPQSKEILRYKEAMWAGLKVMQEAGGLSTNVLVNIVQVLRAAEIGVRKTIGTKLANPVTKEIIYTPPEGHALILDKLSNLEKYIHEESDVDPIIKAGLMHYQFEAIHPFTDGNGRTGRIAIVLYLVQQNLLQHPVLFVSAAFLQTRSEYYKLLNAVTAQNAWKAWLLYFVRAVAQTAKSTLSMVSAIDSLRQTINTEVEINLGKHYASEIASLLHQYPYIKISTLIDRGIAKRETASKYLNQLVEAGVLTDVKSGRDRYFINHRLVAILATG